MNTGIYFLRLQSGRIIEVQSLWDNLNLPKQLGATITPPQTDDPMAREHA